MRAVVAGAAATSVAVALTVVGATQVGAVLRAPQGHRVLAQARPAAAASTSTRYLVFVGAPKPGQKYGLYRSTPGSTSRTVLVAPGGPRVVEDPPAVDPSGTRVAFAFQDASGTGIAITSISGKGTFTLVHVPKNQPVLAAPTWSADGRTLVVERFALATAKAVGLATIKAVKGSKLVTIKGSAGLTYPRFLPRSSTQLVARRPQDGATVVVKVTGGTSVVGRFNAYGVEVSPNLKWLVYHDGVGGVWVRPWKAKGAARLLAKRATVEFPTFSANSALVYFDSEAANAGGRFDIFSVTVTGKAVVKEIRTPNLDEWGVAVAR